ncbi:MULTISPECIES: ArsC/Spx/MgsR family protein [Methylomonas]|uniref:ArsC/Spx/MgsR family protein n=1 Tax=Methylomonas TaxID=416 RepID=UPI0012327C64|nr:ArsC/Spx/MgsR family protein [Methylomonas rhizoryzae]
MAIVHFYEKPGCINNNKQKQLLSKAGHLLIVYDLLQQPWKQDRAKLRSFFGSMPVQEWFNRSAPAIKSGAINPDILSEPEAIELMVSDPILIRRPLLEVDGKRRAGFEAEQIDAWLGLDTNRDANDPETCTRQHRQQACSP